MRRIVGNVFLSVALFIAVIMSPARADETDDIETRYFEAVEQTLMDPTDQEKVAARAKAARDFVVSLLPLSNDVKAADSKEGAYATALSVYEETWKNCFPAAQKDRSVAQSLTTMTRHIRIHTGYSSSSEIIFQRMERMESLAVAHPDDTQITIEMAWNASKTLSRHLSDLAIYSHVFQLGDESAVQERIDRRNRIDRIYRLVGVLASLNPEVARSLHLWQGEIISWIIETYRDAFPTEEEMQYVVSLYQNLVAIERLYPDDDTFLCRRIASAAELTAFFLGSRPSSVSGEHETPLRSALTAYAFSEFQTALKRPAPDTTAALRKRMRILRNSIQLFMGGNRDREGNRDMAEYAYEETKRIAALYTENEESIALLMSGTHSFIEELMRERSKKSGRSEKKDTKRAQEVLTELLAIEARTPEQIESKEKYRVDSERLIAMALLDEGYAAAAESLFEKNNATNAYWEIGRMASDMSEWFLKNGDLEKSKTYYRAFKDKASDGKLKKSAIAYRIENLLQIHKEKKTLSEADYLIEDLRELAKSAPDEKAITGLLELYTQN